MSLLNPGGLRAAPFSRLFTFHEIKTAIRRNKPDHEGGGRGSIAEGNRHGGKHEHKREIARRLRQQERRSG